MLPHTDAKGAAWVAEEVRRAVERLGVAHEDSRPAGIVTASLGVGAATPMPVSDAVAGVRELLAAADAALYWAKRDGRNRLVGATATVVQPAALPRRPDTVAAIRDQAAH